MNRVGKSKFDGIENAYILVSAYRDKSEQDLRLAFRYNMSFLYDAGGVAAEWEPRHGPIQIWEEADKQQTDVKDHYFYDLVIDDPLAYSQLAVDREHLQDAFVAGNYAHIFEVLKRWAKR